MAKKFYNLERETKEYLKEAEGSFSVNREIISDINNKIISRKNTGDYVGIYRDVPIPLNGLNFWFDAMVPKSIIEGSAQNLYGPVGDMLLIGSPKIFGTVYGDCLRFQNNIQYGYYVNHWGADITVITIGMSEYDLWQQWGLLGSCRSSNGYIIHSDLNSNTLKFYLAGQTTNSVSQIYAISFDDIKLPRFYAISHNNSLNAQLIYIDNTKVQTNISVARNSSAIFNRGYLASDASRIGPVLIFSHLVYNRALGSDEIEVIFNAYKKRIKGLEK